MRGAVAQAPLSRHGDGRLDLHLHHGGVQSRPIALAPHARTKVAAHRRRATRPRSAPAGRRAARSAGRFHPAPFACFTHHHPHGSFRHYGTFFSDLLNRSCSSAAPPLQKLPQRIRDRPCPRPRHRIRRDRPVKRDQRQRQAGARGGQFLRLRTRGPLPWSRVCPCARSASASHLRPRSQCRAHRAPPPRPAARSPGLP